MLPCLRRAARVYPESSKLPLPADNLTSPSAEVQLLLITTSQELSALTEQKKELMKTCVEHFARLSAYCKTLESCTDKEEVVRGLLQAERLFDSAVEKQKPLGVEGRLLPSLLERQVVFLDEKKGVISTAAHLWKDHLSLLDKKLMSLDPNKRVKELEVYLTIGEAALTLQTSGCGFVWEVGPHRLVGTIHLPDLLEKSSVITQIGKVDLFYCESVEVTREQPSSVMDRKLMESMGSNNSMLLSLEEKELNMAIAKIFTSGSITLSQLEGRLSLYWSIRGWLEGNENLIQNALIPPQIREVTIEKRNQLWVLKHKLVQLLKNAKPTIGIAVGAAHFFGKGGLLEIFEQAGLKPERM
ncbi:MAG: TraB/GumN family protein [Parachlamydiales bacterium]